MDVNKVKQTCLEIDSLVGHYSVSISYTHVQSLVIFGHVYDLQVKHPYFFTKHFFESLDVTFVMRYFFTISQPHRDVCVKHVALQHNSSLKDSSLAVASHLEISNLNFFGYMSCTVRIVQSVNMNGHKFYRFIMWGFVIVTVLVWVRVQPLSCICFWWARDLSSPRSSRW